MRYPSVGKKFFCCFYIKFRCISSDRKFVLKTNLIYATICDGCKEEYVGQIVGQ